MPTYEYICEACQNEFEKYQSIKSDAITLCPACGVERVRRKISGGAAILFKGGGFYETDYRSAGYNEAKKKDTADGGAAKPAETKPETAAAEPAKAAELPKTESKPAAPAASPDTKSG